MAVAEDAKKRLRQYLNPTLRGKNVDILLDSLSSAAAHMIDNAEAVYDQLYIVTASGRYLDQRMADRGLTRPDNVGLSDEIFRELGIDVSNRKQIRDLLLNILRIMYGEEFTRATLISSELETYSLVDGDTLILQFDDEEDLEVVFNSSQFSNISAATAQEVADAITKEIRRLGRRGSAIAKDDGLGGFVQLISETDGPSSTIRVLGGRAQNELKFEQIRSTSGLATTQWTLEIVAGGLVRARWTGGPNPSIGKIRKGDYANLYGSSFDAGNRGTFTITKVQGGLINEAFVEYENPNAVAETVLQGAVDSLLFFNPLRANIARKTNFATLYQTENRLLEIFMPATTRVVRRDRAGAAHLHESGASTVDDLGPYTFDITKPFIIGGEEANTTELVDSTTSRVVQVDDASDIPDEPGELVFGFATSKEEGPVPYTSRPSSTTLLIDPSYKFQNVHEAGTNVSFVAQNFAYDVSKDATDFPFYITDIVSGRIFAEEIIELVAATGINVVITILYPEDEGLGKWGDEVNSEKFEVWGPDKT
jgi:hypothetical protein